MSERHGVQQCLCNSDDFDACDDVSTGDQQSRYNSDIIDKLLGAVNVKHDPRKQKNTIGEQSMSYYYTMKKRVVEVDSAKLIFSS